MSFNIKRKSGFTLAEVLITLTIIGIIASVTIPALVQSVNNKKMVSRLLKNTSILGQATAELLNDCGGDLYSCSSYWTNADTAVAAFATKLNFIEVCGTPAGCFPNVTYKYLNNNNWGNVRNSATAGKGILADGTLFVIYVNSTCSGTQGPIDDICGYMYVDLNGASSPNQIGRDFFGYFVTRTALVIRGTANEADCATQGWGCTAKVLTDQDITY